MPALKLTPQYVTGPGGKRSAVQLPLKQWEQIVRALRAKQQADVFVADLQEALAHVRAVQCGNTKAVSARKLF